jgi:hypothetical protein
MRLMRGASEAPLDLVLLRSLISFDFEMLQGRENGREKKKKGRG